MNAKNWSFFYSREEKKGEENIVETISLWCAIGLLWWSFCSIVMEHFPQFLEVQVIVPWLFVLWAAHELPKESSKKWYLWIHILGIGIPIGYILIQYEKIINGVFAMLHSYLEYYNVYYGTEFYVDPGKLEDAPIALTVFAMLCWWIVWLLAYGFKKKVLLVLFPVIALVMELLVGVSPVGNGLIFLLVAAVLLVNMRGAAVAKKVIVVAGVLGSVLLSNLWFEEDIKTLSTKESKEAVLNWQNNIDLTNVNWESLLQIDFHFNRERLTNKTPQYIGKVILEMESDRKPSTTIYLRGFYATDYENGTWKYDDSHFKAACKEMGISETEAAKELFDMSYNISKMLDDAADESMEEVHYKITYNNISGDVAYAPYFSSYDSLDEDYELVGDYLLKKDIWDDTIVGNAFSASTNTWYFLDIFYRDVVSKEAKEKEFEWYNDLATAYLEVPEGMEFVSKAATDIQQWIPRDYYRGIYSNTRGYRIDMAEMVKLYLAEKMSYSLILDDLPYDADPVEYALTESHEGYCMHFASAATLILRELGVPARYVSGYVINPGKFKTSDEVTFKAEVTDYASHAWVEIYLDDIGWIPVEVTPGYDSGEVAKLPSEMNKEAYERVSEDRKASIEEQEDASEETSEVPLEEPTEQENSESEVTEEQENSEQDNTEIFPENDNIQDKKEEDVLQIDGDKTKENLLAFLNILIVVTITIVMIAIGVKYWQHQYEMILKEEIQKNLYRSAIKRINKRIYGRLRIKNFGKVTKVPLFGYLTDTKYEQMLIDTFPTILPEDWARYMDIVKKTHYSMEKPSEEEMMHCYDCYKITGELTILKQFRDMIQGNDKK